MSDPSPLSIYNIDVFVEIFNAVSLYYWSTCSFWSQTSSVMMPLLPSISGGAVAVAGGGGGEQKEEAKEEAKEEKKEESEEESDDDMGFGLFD